MIFCEAGILGIDYMQILYHLFNFVVLFIAYKFLLHKKIKQFIETRKERFENDRLEVEKLNGEANRKKEEYSRLVDEAIQELSTVHIKAEELVAIKKSMLIKTAEQEAERIIAKANDDISVERIRMKKEMKEEVANLAVDIASKVIEREVSMKDNEKIIEKSLEDWAK